jgi:eukaryotic-like serine/threonine-protein kinase
VALLPGWFVGPYQIVRLLGSGGMGRVYLARIGTGLDERLVALKVISSESAPEVAETFRHEAQVSASFRHPNVVEVLDTGVAEDGTPYLAMQLVHGATLREVLKAAHGAGRILPLGFAISVVAAAAEGLHHAHDQRGPSGPLGIVHRDISPSNLMVGHDGAVRVIDFGIARSRVKIHDTVRGIVKGKAAYMSPEQLCGDPLDRRSDVFSLGVVAYEATTQTRAFANGSELDSARRVIRVVVKPPALVRPGYPPELAEVIGRALAVRPEDRWETAEDFGAALHGAASLAGIRIGPAICGDEMRVLFPGALARGTGSHPVLEEPETVKMPRRIPAPPPEQLTVSIDDMSDS